MGREDSVRAVLLAVLLAGCATARPVAEYAVIDVTAVTHGWPVPNATVYADDVSAAESATSTDEHGTTTTYVHWSWSRRYPTDDAGQYHDVLLTVDAIGYRPWRSVIRVRPARITQVLASLEGVTK